MLNKLHFIAHLTVCRSTSVTVLTLFLFDTLIYRYFAVFDHLNVGSPRGDNVIIVKKVLFLFTCKTVRGNCFVVVNVVIVKSNYI